MPDVENKLSVFSWYPYENGKCGVNITVKLIDVWIKNSFQNEVNLFPNKVPNYLNGCPVKVRVLNWPPYALPPTNEPIVDNKILNITQGIEVEIFKAIAEKINLTVLFTSSTVPHDWGLASVDGNTSGTIKAVKEKTADIGMGAFGSTLERNMYCDYSASDMQEYIIWCVPKANRSPKWKHILKIFDIYSWLVMLSLYLILSILIYFVSEFKPRDSSTFIYLKNCFLYTFSIFLGISAKDTPRKLSGRILYYVWIILGLLFIAAYQAKLIGLLIKPLYEKQISTFEEIINSGMSYSLLPTLKRFYSNTDDSNVAKIVNNWYSCTNSSSCLKRVAYERNYALSTVKIHAKFESLKYMDQEGGPLIFCIDYLLYWVQIYMTKGFPLRERIDQLIYRLGNSGLKFKWHNDIERIAYLKYRKQLNRIERNQDTLTLDHMQGAFLLWSMGLAMSVVFFVFEIIYNKNKKKFTLNYYFSK